MTIIRGEQMAAFERAGHQPPVLMHAVDHVAEAIEKIRQSTFGQGEEGRRVLANLPTIAFAPMKAPARTAWAPGTLTISERLKENVDAIASEIVHGALLAGRAGPSGDARRGRLRQLEFYEEQRALGFRDPELEQRRRDRETGGSGADDPGATDAPNGHVGVPEPILLLRLAARAIAEYHRRTGTLPREWPALDVTFANGPYRISDAQVRPGPGTGTSWRPEKCDYSYRLLVESDRVRVQALDGANVVAYHIEPGMEDPRPGPG